MRSLCESERGYLTPTGADGEGGRDIGARRSVWAIGVFGASAPSCAQQRENLRRHLFAKPDAVRFRLAIRDRR